MPREESNEESQHLINNNENRNVNNNENRNDNNKTIPLPHVTYLIFAAFFHLLGNVSDVVGDSESSYVFL